MQLSWQITKHCPPGKLQITNDIIAKQCQHSTQRACWRQHWKGRWRRRTKSPPRWRHPRSEDNKICPDGLPWTNKMEAINIPNLDIWESELYNRTAKNFDYYIDPMKNWKTTWVVKIGMSNLNKLKKWMTLFCLKAYPPAWSCHSGWWDIFGPERL